MKYACIEAHRRQFPITLMCRVLGVSRAGFYAARTRELCGRAQEDQRLRLEIRAIHRESRQRYGSPRIHAELQARGSRCARKRVARLMREDGLRARKRRRFRVTTKANARDAKAANLLERRFSVDEQCAPDRVWVADITYVPTREGWLYLAVILDLASRMVVGWALQPYLDRSLTIAALQMALGRRCPKTGLLHHSDRGSQYTADDYLKWLDAQGIIASMSRKGDCWDNAVAESFFATLEWELIQDADWHSRAEASRAIFEYLEVWYNRQRRHSSLGYMTPVEYEAQLALTRRAA